ncbi:MAG TPA: sensor histidine kinase [Bacilli bacterium]
MGFNLNNVRIRSKMLILYFLSVFIPIIFTNIMFYTVTTNNVRNQKIRDISLAMEQTSKDFRAQIDLAVGISEVLYTDSLLNDALDKSYPHPSAYVEAYHNTINYTIGKFSPVYKAIKNIEIYTTNPTIIGGGSVLPITGEIRKTEWYRELMNIKGSSPLVIRNNISSLTGANQTFSVIRRLDYHYMNKWQKILKIDIDIHTIEDVLHNVTVQGDIYLLGKNDTIEYTTNPKVDWSTRHVKFAQDAMAAGMHVFERNFRNVSYLKDWRIVGVVSEKNVLEDVHKSRNMVLYLAIPNIVIPTLIILWITRSLNLRIIRVLKHMKQVKRQNFELIRHENYRDEIGQLTEEFNRMIRQIRKLINEVYVADIQKKDLEIKRKQAQLHALQSQINPHFLFNALETIRMRSLIKKEQETARIIYNMAKIFRKSLTWEKDWVTVNEELDLIHCFLEIQKYRFGEKLDYSIQASPEAGNCLIPKMSILPFVENASIHGIENLKDMGAIHLQIIMDEETLLCTVTDNGIGMSEEKRNALLKDLYENESMGERIGIKNVFYRLKLYYGDRFELKIDSAQGAGTRVTIRFPLRDTVISQQFRAAEN